MTDIYDKLRAVTDSVLMDMAEKHRFMIGLGDPDYDKEFCGFTDQDVAQNRCVHWARQAVEALGGHDVDCFMIWHDVLEEKGGRPGVGDGILYYQGRYYNPVTLHGVDRVELLDIWPTPTGAGNAMAQIESTVLAEVSKLREIVTRMGAKAKLLVVQEVEGI